MVTFLKRSGSDNFAGFSFPLYRHNCQPHVGVEIKTHILGCVIFERRQAIRIFLSRFGILEMRELDAKMYVVLGMRSDAAM